MSSFTTKQYHGRQRDKDVISTTILIVRFGFDQYPGYIIAFLDKAFYNDYLGLLAAN